MHKPKMILFDYGQTLIAEASFDGIKGTEAVFKYATKNKYNKTAQEIQEFVKELNSELGRFNPQTRHLMQIEIPNHMFTKYLYESQGIQIDLKPEEIDKIFWDAASPGKPTDGIKDFLAFLRENKIRTGVISNICYDPKVVEQRIKECLPDHDFEFIIATSDYVFRKPNKRIFELALEKADLLPEDVWFVGDQFECDIVGAQNANIFPVWYIGAIDLPYAPHPDILTIKNWKELQANLEL